LVNNQGDHCVGTEYRYGKQTEGQSPPAPRGIILFPTEPKPNQTYLLIVLSWFQLEKVSLINYYGRIYN
jgi:hypothetical protein